MSRASISTKPKCSRPPDIIVVDLVTTFAVDAVKRDADGVIQTAVCLLNDFPDEESANEWARKYARDHGYTFHGEQP